jgi:DNA polymerase-1
MQRPRFYLIDGHALAYRQYHALKAQSGGGFRTRSGEMTGAVFGFTRTLLDILLNHPPDYLAVSFDRGLSGRETLFPEYKAQREAMPEDLARQLSRIEQVVQAFNIPVLALDGYEADDVIGTVVQQAERAGLDTRIITGDKDMLQLLTPHVTVQLPKRNADDVIYDVALFQTEYNGLEPWQLVELKGLMGDSSDNIPGVRGVGEVTAKDLLQKYQTIDNIYAHIDEHPARVRNKLIEGESMAYLSRELARIRRDVPVTLELEKCVTRDFDSEVVLDLFRELEFRRFSEQLAAYAQGVQTAADPDTADLDAPAEIDMQTIIVRDEAALNDLIHTLAQAQVIVWDVETTSLDQMSCDLVGIALAVDGQTGYYIPVGHTGSGDLFAEPVQQLPLKTVIDALRGPLTNPTIAKYAHNAEFDLIVTERFGIPVQPVTFDTMIAEWLRDPTSKFTGLKSFALQYLKVRMTDISALLGKGKKKITMAQVEVERAAPYAAADAVMTYRAAQLLRPELEADPDLWRLYTTLEMPLIPVIVAMERAGVLLDTVFLKQLSAQLEDELRQLEKRIHDMGGVTFNINSPRQLNEVLFDKLGLSVEGLRKTTLGYSTDATTLDNLRGSHPIIEEILKHRELTKIKGTYVDALPALINPQTGRLHTSFNQTGTATGRLSSSNPNLQNIPIRTELGREVRRGFITPPGTQLLAVDYSQIELRVLAHYSEDPTLLAAFAQGQDIHAATAAAVYGIPLAEVTYDQRSFAKRVNFGLIYGMGAFRLARDSNLSLGEARRFIDDYFARLPKVKEYLDRTKEQARQGPLTTLFGRRREFRALRAQESDDASTRSRSNDVQAEERMAINMPIQGSAADIIKKAMIDLHQALRERQLGARILLQVHDELVLEVPEDQLVETTRLVITVMENAYELKAPLKANAEVGPNWLDMEPIRP